MAETQQRRIDPESLSRMNAEKATPLQDIFVHCMKGKVALVSGGASGLGYMVVNRLCEAGAKVVIASRGEARAKRALEDLRSKGYEVTWVQTDVSKVDACYAAVDCAVNTYGSLDVLVTCAAGWSSYSYLDLPETVYDRIMDTDLKGSYFLGQAAARYMVANKIKGKIVFISSAAHLGEGPKGIGMNSYYAAAKAGVVAMTKTVSGELRQFGINVNCVAPGGMLSAGVFTEGAEAFSLYGPEYKAVRDSHGSGSPDATPLAMNPDEVALVVFAMCTPMADFMQGETVNVNGGTLMITQERPFSFTVEGCIPGPKAE